MSKQKRYVAVIEYYVYAESDEQALAQVRKRCQEQEQKEDDGCHVLKLVEQTFGSLGSREIKN